MTGWHQPNALERRDKPRALCSEIAGAWALADVRTFLATSGLGAPTPLVSLPGLAASLGLARITVKDESARMGLNSFKALGGAYAVARLALEAAGERVGRLLGFNELASPAAREVAASITFACATDGNHGRAVALGARLAGARAVVFVHEGVAPARRARLAADGAEVIEAKGVYDDSLVAARAAAAANGWMLVSDCAFEGYEAIPTLVMRGYGVMIDEALGGEGRAPTHVFVQCGVGGLAGAVAAALLRWPRATRPRLVVVEPERAACLLTTARAGRLVKIAEAEPTVMALLECYEPSLTAWRLLASATDLYLAVDDALAVEAARRFEQPLRGDPMLASSESGAAGLAGLVSAAGDPQLRDLAGLDAASRVLLINSERRIDAAP